MMVDFKDLEVREAFRDFILLKLQQRNKTIDWLIKHSGLSKDTINDRVLAKHLLNKNIPTERTRTTILKTLECSFFDFEDYLLNNRTGWKNLVEKFLPSKQTAFSIFIVCAVLILYLRTPNEITLTINDSGQQQPISVKISHKQYKDELLALESKLRAEYVTSDQAQKTILENQLDSVNQKINNSEIAYMEHISELKEKIASLEENKDKYSPSEYRAAILLLVKGDTSKADELLATINSTNKKPSMIPANNHEPTVGEKLENWINNQTEDSDQNIQHNIDHNNSVSVYSDNARTADNKDITGISFLENKLLDLKYLSYVIEPIALLKKTPTEPDIIYTQFRKLTNHLCPMRNECPEVSDAIRDLLTLTPKTWRNSDTNTFYRLSNYFNSFSVYSGTSSIEVKLGQNGAANVIATSDDNLAFISFPEIGLVSIMNSSDWQNPKYVSLGFDPYLLFLDRTETYLFVLDKQGRQMATIHIPSLMVDSTYDLLS